MRLGNVELRLLGGGLGCLLKVLVLVVASVVLTVLVNLLLGEPCTARVELQHQGPSYPFRAASCVAKRLPSPNVQAQAEKS